MGGVDQPVNGCSLRMDGAPRLELTSCGRCPKSVCLDPPILVDLAAIRSSSFAGRFNAADYMHLVLNIFASSRAISVHLQSVQMVWDEDMVGSERHGRGYQ